MIVRDVGTPEETRFSSRAIIQSKSGQFNVDTPIYVGDVVELPDPRGGVRQLYVAEVNITDVDGRGADFDGMGHISVRWGSPPEPSREPGHTIVNVRGGVNQFAWNNREVHQAQGGEWPTDLSAVLARIIQEAPAVEIEDADRALLVEDAQAVVESIAADEPPTARRRTLAAIRGVLAEIASGAGQGVGQGGVAWAQAALQALAGG